MTNDALFYKIFKSDFQKYNTQFLKSFPAKKEHYFCNSLHQYQNNYVVEFSNGKVITESCVSNCGIAKKTIKKESVIHRVVPSSHGNSVIIPISHDMFQNEKRILLIQKAVKEIRARNYEIEGLALKWIAFEKLSFIVNSTGFAHSKIETFASIDIEVKIRKNKILYNGKAIRSFNFETNMINEKVIYSLIDNAFQDAANNYKAKKINSGVYDVIFSNITGAVLFHEIIGHLVEADYVFNNRSILSGSVNKMVASSQLTIIDSPHINGPVEFPFDDEGTIAQKTTIIEKGILKNLLSDQYYSINNGIIATGNARCPNYAALPLTRMSNTVICAGQYSYDEILESTKKGLFISDLGSGYINTLSGEFQFENGHGFYIEDGLMKYPIQNIKITGNAIEVLNSVKMVGNDHHISPFHADCEKENQIIPVGFAQPTIKITALKIS